MGYGLDEEMKTEETGLEDGKIVAISDKKKRMPFACWTVNGRDYKLKLTTTVICQLEEKFKRNLLDLLFSNGSIPPLAVMLTITQGAMKTWEHGVKYADVQRLFDLYCEDGGTQLSFMTNVLMPIYSASGFFSEDQQAAMEEKLEETADML
ncbi:MAG: DUF6096 family protein [Hungatella sp.]